MNGKKAKSSCWDCGQQGHWSGDNGCPNPGAGLFKPKPSGNKPTKHVRVAEALTTEYSADEPAADEGHEVMTMSRILYPSSLEEALTKSHETCASQVQRLSLDKKLMGALASACNRTCCGTVWLKHYLNALLAAPQAIQSLVQQRPEQEVFKFGDGGTQRSTVRYRLPMVVGDDLVLTWVSIIPVGSLGLLLGRDWLDAVGCVLSFSKKVMRADHLSGKHIPLRQLTAGHFALHLIPPEWPSPGAQRWRRVGLDGVVALQISHSDWVHRKLLAVQSSQTVSARGHEHLLLEHSMFAADVKLFGLPVSCGDGICLAQMDKVHPARSSSTSPSSSPGRSLAPGKHGHAGRQDRQPLASSHRQMPGKSAMARARHCLVALAAAVAAISSLSIPLNCQHKAMAVASSADGRIQVALPKAFRTRSGSPSLHNWQFEGNNVVERPLGMGDSFHRGSDAPRDDGCKKLKGNCQQDPSGSNLGSEGGRPQGQRRGQTIRGRSSSDRTSRRTSIAEERSLEVGCAAQRRIGRKGHDRTVEDRHSPSPPSSHEQSAKAARSRKHHQWSKLSHGASQTFDSQIRGPHFNPSARSDNSVSGTFRNSDLRSSNARHPRTSRTTRSEVPGNAVPSDAAHDVYATRSFGTSSDEWTALRGRDVAQHGRRGCPHGEQRFSRVRLDESRNLRSSELHDRRRNEEDQRGTEEVPEGRRDRAAEGPILWDGHGPMNNPWTIHQELKKGQAKMIQEAWEKHCRDRKAVSKSPKEVQESMKKDWDQTFSNCLNENFMMKVEIGPQKGKAVRPRAGAVAQAQPPVPSPPRKKKKKEPDKESRPLLGEVYTATEQVARQARLRGHRVTESTSLETGWNFLQAEDRKACIKRVIEEKPFCLVLAFPCGPWSPLTRLKPSSTLEDRRKEGKVLIEFAIALASIQLKHGGHFILENPKTSLAWALPELSQFLESAQAEYVDFDQCAFLLRSLQGFLHKKPARVATSSTCVAEELRGMTCARDRYPVALARAFVRGLERQFHAEYGQCREVNAVDGMEEDDPGDTMPVFDSESDVSSVGEDDEPAARISSSVRLAVKRLHENTGHRSNRRLARALVLSGAPKEVVHAAKQLRCSLCDEKKRPKPRRHSSLPSPKDVSDQVHIDIFECSDAAEQRFYAVHAIDWTSRFQMAEALSTKDSDSVTKWFQERWMSIFGPPRVLVADQGREFISWAFQEMCDRRSILLHHIPVQAPRCNGVCERGGGILKGLIECCVKSRSVMGLEDFQVAVQECVMAYNADVNELGVSPAQAAIGRQPRMIGDVLGSFSQRLAEHGLIDGKPNIARQIALRETARVAMTRLHFSKGIRRAELNRSRTSTMSQPLSPGDIVYFWRESKYNSRTSPSKKRLSLRRWHGPALLVALEGQNAGYFSFKGQLTKCAREHLRAASSMEQISADVWHDAIQDCVEAALHDMHRIGTEHPPPTSVDTPATPRAPVTPATLPTVPEQRQLDAHEELPPVRPSEIVQALDPGMSELPSSGSLSRRASLVAAASREHSRQISSAAPGTPVPELITQASQTPQLSERLEASIEDLRNLEDRKRSAEMDAEELRSASGAIEARSHSTLVTYAVVRNVLKPKKALMSQYAKSEPLDIIPEANPMLLEEKKFEEALKNSTEHPLKVIQKQVEVDRLNAERAEVQDHGSWSGRWPLPSRTSWMAHEACCVTWPTSANEVNAAKTARREIKWKEIPEEQKNDFREAAKVGWKVQTDNGAFEILSDEESKRVWAKLRESGQLKKVLVPRFVFTDKNDGARSDSNPLPLLANARVVAPGYQDETAYNVRKDAPTSSRSSQHILFITAASKAWTIWSADVKSAFLKGELFEEGERELYITNIRRSCADEPLLPFSADGWAKVRKGVFGLADSPRRWYIRLNKSLIRLGWKRSTMDAAQWVLYGPNDRTEGMIVSHVDDLLLAGSSTAYASLKALGEELGFGSLEQGSFAYCGKNITQNPDYSIEVNMKAYHENVQPAVVPMHRKKQLDSPLTPGEHRQLRALVGSMQWLVRTTNCQNALEG